eukprot:12889341-Ditylum_brightwellii.AAC.1
MEIFADLGQALLKRSISPPEVVVVIYIALSVEFPNARSATLTRLPSRLTCVKSALHNLDYVS